MAASIIKTSMMGKEVGVSRKGKGSDIISLVEEKEELFLFKEILDCINTLIPIGT